MREKICLKRVTFYNQGGSMSKTCNICGATKLTFCNQENSTCGNSYCQEANYYFNMVYKNHRKNVRKDALNKAKKAFAQAILNTR